MKAAVEVLHPFAFNALRLTLGTAALGLVERRERGGASPPPVPWRGVLPFALLSSLLYQWLFVSGMSRTSAGHTALIIASGPLWTALIARLAGVDRIPRRAWAGLVGAVAGTALVTSVPDAGGVATLGGNLLVLLAMLAWAIATVQSRPLMERVPPTRLAYLAALVALPGHWLLALPHLAPVVERGLEPWLWGAVAYSGLLSTGVAYVLWNESVRTLGPSRTAAFINLVPVVALVVACLALGERPSAAQLGGGALVIAGVASWRATSGGGRRG
jgi:drug/metabolite transporter (DMT)-like permease